MLERIGEGQCRLIIVVDIVETEKAYRSGKPSMILFASFLQKKISPRRGKRKDRQRQTKTDKAGRQGRQTDICLGYLLHQPPTQLRPREQPPGDRSAPERDRQAIILSLACHLRRQFSTILHELQRKQKTRKHGASGILFGGDKRDRTADLLNAIQA